MTSQSHPATKKNNNKKFCKSWCPCETIFPSPQEAIEKKKYQIEKKIVEEKNDKPKCENHANKAKLKEKN